MILNRVCDRKESESTLIRLGMNTVCVCVRERREVG